MYQGIERFIQYIMADETIWNNYTSPIPDKCCVIAKSSDNDFIMKIGNGSLPFSSLPIFMKFSRILNTFYLDSINIDVVNDIDKIMYYNEDLKLVSTSITLAQITQALGLIDTIDLRGNIVIPYIIGPRQAKIGDTIFLTPCAYNLLKRCQVELIDAVWTDPYGSEYIGLDLNYEVPLDSTQLGQYKTFKVKVKDKYNNWSRTVEKPILLVNTRTSGYVYGSTSTFKKHITDAPIIKDLIWNNIVHVANNTYTLTIDAEDPNDLDLQYEVKASDIDVVINQNDTNPSVFEVTYPDYRYNTEVYYIVTVTNSAGKVNKTSNKKTVIPS